MLDHVSLGVFDIDRSRYFYEAVLRSLGLVRIVDFGASRGSDYGAAPGPFGVELTITRETQVTTVWHAAAEVKTGYVLTPGSSDCSAEGDRSIHSNWRNQCPGQATAEGAQS
jgi:catechol 2,3-dioxygenase-like lactoylglutathione lyase family enzyme